MENINTRIAIYAMDEDCELHVTRTPTHIHVDVIDLDLGCYIGCGRIWKYETHGVEGAIAKALAFADAMPYAVKVAG